MLLFLLLKVVQIIVNRVVHLLKIVVSAAHRREHIMVQAVVLLELVASHVHVLGVGNLLLWVRIVGVLWGLLIVVNQGLWHWLQRGRSYIPIKLKWLRLSIKHHGLLVS